MTSRTARNSAEFLAGHSSHFPPSPRTSGPRPRQFPCYCGGRSAKTSEQPVRGVRCLGWLRPFSQRLSSLVSWWGLGCTVHAPRPLGGGEKWPSHELCRTECRGQAGAERGLAGGAVIQRFPELRRRRQGGRVWGSVVAAEGVSPNRILDEQLRAALRPPSASRDLAA